MDAQAEALLKEAFRSGIAQAYNLAPQSEVINNPESFYPTFQQNVAVWNPNIPNDTASNFPGANKVIYGFPLHGGETRNLTELCISSPFTSFGRAISCWTFPYISAGLANASADDLSLAAKYGVYRIAPAISSNISQTFATYISVYEKYNTNSGCRRNVLLRNGTGLDLQKIAGCMRAICESASDMLTINSDIIGIGVWTAYFIQVGICFLAPILVFLFRKRPRRPNLNQILIQEVHRVQTEESLQLQQNKNKNHPKVDCKTSKLRSQPA